MAEKIEESEDNSFDLKVPELDKPPYFWEKLESNQPDLVQRLAHASYVLCDDHVYVFGGEDPCANCNWNNNLLEWNVITNEWTKLVPDSASTVPCARTGHSSVLYKRKMYIFGGDYWVDDSRSQKKMSAELYCYDIDKNVWTQIEAKGNCPSGRSFHSAVEHKGIMHVYGGFKTEDGNGYGDAEYWTYEFAHNTWKLIGSSWQARARHCMGVCKETEELWVFGGMDLSAMQRQNYMLATIYSPVDKNEWKGIRRSRDLGWRGPNGEDQGPSMAIVGKNLFVFGHNNQEKDYCWKLTRLSWATDTEDWEWKKMDGDIPTNRIGGWCFIVGDIMYFHGGGNMFNWYRMKVN